MKKHILLALLFIAGSTLTNAQVFVDWTSLNNPVSATGTHPVGGTVTWGATGSTVVSEGGVTNSTYNGWNSSDYTPALTNADFVGARFQNAGDVMIVDFANPVQNPVLHIVSMQGTYTFGGNITILSSSSGGHTVSGQTLTANGSFNGTIQIAGNYSSIPITGLSYLGGTCTSGCSDGINFHIGADNVVVPVPAMSLWGMIIIGLFLAFGGLLMIRKL